MRNTKPSPLQIKLTTDEAGQKLYELVFAALNKDFELSSNPEQIIASARQEFEDPSLTKSTVEDVTIPTSTSTPDDPAATEAAESPTKNVGAVNGETNPEPIIEIPKSPSIHDYERISEPELQSDGWARTGYINKSGEEFLLTPPENCPYRAPHTYADEKLPLPPVSSRSEQYIENDSNLGFPPLLGDRNIPFFMASEFATEDIAEEKARSQAHKRKLSQIDREENVRKAKRRRPSKSFVNGTTPATTPATATTTSTTVTAATMTQEEKPKIQRLKLKLKPPTDAEREEFGIPQAQASNSHSTPRGAKTRGQGHGGRGGNSTTGTPRSNQKTNGKARGGSRGGTPRSRLRGRGRG